MEINVSQVTIAMSEVFIMFIRRDENKSRIYRKKHEFSVYYILSVILNTCNSVINKNS